MCDTGAPRPDEMMRRLLRAGNSYNIDWGKSPMMEGHLLAFEVCQSMSLILD